MLTYEIPGGHREANEDIRDSARRELFEETGALEFMLNNLCDYSVEKGGIINYGRIFATYITKLGNLPESEMGEVILSDTLPKCWIYPEIQPKFIECYKKIVVSRETTISIDNAQQ